MYQNVEVHDSARLRVFQVKETQKHRQNLCCLESNQLQRTKPEASACHAACASGRVISSHSSPAKDSYRYLSGRPVRPGLLGVAGAKGLVLEPCALFRASAANEASCIPFPKMEISINWYQLEWKILWNGNLKCKLIVYHKLCTISWSLIIDRYPQNGCFSFESRARWLGRILDL